MRDGRDPRRDGLRRRTWSPTSSAHPVKRVEDPQFITGKGRYLDDIKLPGMTHVAILRSPYAHANIRSIDIAAAKAAPGVLAVIVGADIPYNPLPMAWPAGGACGHPEQRQHARASSPRIRVKWTGEGVAAVVAETPRPRRRTRSS